MTTVDAPPAPRPQHKMSPRSYISVCHREGNARATLRAGWRVATPECEE